MWRRERERARRKVAARCCLQRAWAMGVEWEYFSFSFLSCFRFRAVLFPSSFDGWFVAWLGVGWVGSIILRRDLHTYISFPSQ